MPMTPFMAQTKGGEIPPSQEAALQGLGSRNALGSSELPTGQNPVAMHLLAVFNAFVKRGGLPEDGEAIQQFLQLLQNLFQQSGVMPPQGQAPMPGPPGPMPQG